MKARLKYDDSKTESINENPKLNFYDFINDESVTDCVPPRKTPHISVPFGVFNNTNNPCNDHKFYNALNVLIQSSGLASMVNTKLEQFESSENEKTAKILKRYYLGFSEKIEDTEEFQNYVLQVVENCETLLRQNFMDAYYSDCSQIELYNFIRSCIYNNSRRKELKEHAVTRQAKDDILENYGDGIIDFGYMYFNDSLWAIRAIMTKNGADCKIDILKHIESFLADNKAYLTVFRNALEFLCLNHIRLMFSTNSNINSKNFLETAMISETADIILFIKELYELMYSEALNCATFKWYYSDEKGSAVVKLNEEIKKIKRKAEKNEAKLSKENDSLKKAKKEKEEYIKQLQEKVRQEATKNYDLGYEKGHEGFHEIYQKLKAEQKSYEELEQKYNRLLEFTKELETEEPEIENEQNEQNISEAVSKIADKNIVFVRGKKCEGFLVMRKIEEYLPNAKIVATANEINTKSTDLVVVLTKFIGHSAYWKIKDYAKNANVPCIHSVKVSFEGIVYSIIDALNI